MPVKACHNLFLHRPVQSFLLRHLGQALSSHPVARSSPGLRGFFFRERPSPGVAVLLCRQKRPQGNPTSSSPLSISSLDSWRPTARLARERRTGRPLASNPAAMTSASATGWPSSPSFPCCSSPSSTPSSTNGESHAQTFPQLRWHVPISPGPALPCLACYL